MRALRFIISLLMVGFLVSLGAFGQQRIETLRYLNLEWEMTSEQVLGTLKSSVKTIKEDLSIEAKDKAIGIRVFKSNSRKERIRFAEIEWDSITLTFLNDKLSEVELTRERLDYYKLRDELEVRLGKPETARIPGGTARVAFWTAEDNSIFALANLDPGLGPDVTLATFSRPFFSEDKTKLLEAQLRSSPSDWVTTKTAPKKLDVDEPPSFSIMDNNWGKSSEELNKLVRERLGSNLTSANDSLSDDEKAIAGFDKYFLSKYEYEGFFFSVNADFFDDKLARIDLINTYHIGLDNAREVERRVIKKYGSDYIDKSNSSGEWKFWNLKDGSIIELMIESSGLISFDWKAPEYDKELAYRKGRAIKK